MPNTQISLPVLGPEQLRATSAILDPKQVALKRAVATDGSIPIKLSSPLFDQVKAGGSRMGLESRILPSEQLKKVAESFRKGPLEPQDYAHLYLEVVGVPMDWGVDFRLNIGAYGQGHETVGAVSNEAMDALKQAFMEEVLRAKEKDEFIPPLDRESNVSSQAHIKAILDPSNAAIRKIWERDAEQTVWINLPLNVKSEIQERLGIDNSEASGDKYPSFRVIPTSELKLAFGTMIYGSYSSDYYLEVIDRGEGDYYLFAKYNQILGSRKLGPVPKEVFEAFKEGLTRAWAQSAHVEYREPDASKEVDRPAPKDEELMEQLQSMSAVANRIELPAEQLTRYADIKTAMQKAGGKYKSPGKGLPAHFVFPARVNAADILEELTNGGRINIQKETQFFATPKAVGLKLIERFGSLQGMRVLEPEAGQAGLADLAKDAGAAEVVTIENWGVNIDVLKSKGYSPIEEDFLQVKPESTGLFDAVVMNPPFSKRQDIAHVRHALSFLKDDGRLEAITSTQFQTSSIKDSKLFKDLTELVDSDVQLIESGAFSESGTSVATVMLSFDMKQLLDRLEESGTDGSEFGLDLSRQWEMRESSRSELIERQRAA
jgi:hypothetical protein